MQKIDEDLGKEVTVTEMRYVHDLEMEDVYKASVLKAVKKTIDQVSFITAAITAGYYFWITWILNHVCISQGLDKLIIYDAQNVRTEVMQCPNAYYISL